MKTNQANGNHMLTNYILMKHQKFENLPKKEAFMVR